MDDPTYGFAPPASKENINFLLPCPFNLLMSFLCSVCMSYEYYNEEIEFILNCFNGVIKLLSWSLTKCSLCTTFGVAFNFEINALSTTSIIRKLLTKL